MEKVHQHVDPKLLESFLDGEVAEGRHPSVREHVEKCLLCGKNRRDNRTIAASVKEGLLREISYVDLKHIESEVLRKMARGKVKGWRGEGSLTVTRNVWGPVAAGVVAVLLFFVFYEPVIPPVKPSAFVQSFKGDVVSVMIFETPRSHQTILWFKEAAFTEAEMMQEIFRGLSRMEKRIETLETILMDHKEKGKDE